MASTLPDDDRGDLHYRIYLDKDDQPVVIAVQWFDYFDYDESRFLSEDRYDTAEEPQALVDIMNAGLVRPFYVIFAVIENG